MDGNKTALTHRVTATAAAYLDGAGFKPVETEVAVADGWIADLASFVYPSRTEAKKLKIVSRNRSAIIEDQEYQELRWRHGHLLTAIVEVKISKGDFAKDKNTKFSSRYLPAHLCYIAYPTDLIETKDIPEGWIGLRMSKDGSRLLKCEISNRRWLHSQPAGSIADLVAQVAIRRDHRTRFRASKDWLQWHRAEESEKKRKNTINDVIMSIFEWLKDEQYGDSSLQETLKYHGINPLRNCIVEKIKWLESVKPLLTKSEVKP